MNDDNAIRLCKDGDQDAFRHLVERYQNTLYGTAFLMTGNKTTAEDHVQEALLSAWRGITGFRTGRPFKPWLVRILVNGIVSQHRRRSVVAVPLDDAERVEEETPDLAESVDAARRHAMVRCAMERLRPAHLQVVALRYFAELSVPQVAEVIGVPQGTAKSRLNRALGYLREELGPLSEENSDD